MSTMSAVTAQMNWAWFKFHLAIESPPVPSHPQVNSPSKWKAGSLRHRFSYANFSVQKTGKLPVGLIMFLRQSAYRNEWQGFGNARNILTTKTGSYISVATWELASCSISILFNCDSLTSWMSWCWEVSTAVLSLNPAIVFFWGKKNYEYLFSSSWLNRKKALLLLW